MHTHTCAHAHTHTQAHTPFAFALLAWVGPLLPDLSSLSAPFLLHQGSEGMGDGEVKAQPGFASQPHTPIRQAGIWPEAPSQRSQRPLGELPQPPLASPPHSGQPGMGLGKISVKSQRVDVSGLRTTGSMSQFLSSVVPVQKQPWTVVNGCVLIKLYLQNQAAGRSLLTPAWSMLGEESGAP